MDVVFAAFDERVGPVAVYSTIKDPLLTKKIAVKSIVATLANVRSTTSKKLEGEAVIPFPEENKVAFIFYSSLNQKTESGENRVISLSAIVENEHKSLLYSKATLLSQKARELKISLNQAYKYGQQLSSDLIKEFETWGQITTSTAEEIIAEKKIAFTIHSLLDLFPIQKTLRKYEDPLVPLFLGIFVKVPVILVGPNIEFLLEIADLLRGYLPSEELDVRLAINPHAESQHNDMSYGIPRADLILLNEEQYRRALFYREPIIKIRIGRNSMYDNYHAPSKAVSFVEGLLKNIRSFKDEKSCNLYLQGEFMAFSNNMSILKDFCVAGKQDSLKALAKKLRVKENYLISLSEALRIRREISSTEINRMFLGKTHFKKTDTMNPRNVGIIQY